MPRIKKSPEDQIKDLKAYIADLENEIKLLNKARESNLFSISLQRNHLVHHHEYIKKLRDENRVLKAALKEIL